ncbi:MAG: UDP-N-acetylglucosamine--N-acetylmuramyl-(pentapeptide) pyrophosphoryl-undecaprenol N-acetylglucosamine transferase [Chloroflexi bacterium]|nr:UDP-N-acetylglucosamine--N-acetylmuramyl-(pentapeptide) pyrophosphoryl-undecaprenol N-acetylglucosamine transferase [Chloroflexota bacterium]
MKVILAGGGSGGHIYPALAVAQALLQETGAARAELLFVGVRGRLDETIVGEAGLPFAAVRAGPLRVGSPLRVLSGLANLAVGLAQAWRLLGRFRPDVVFATGGYGSVAVGIAARSRRRPLVVYLPDLRPGWALRLLSRLATRIATTTEHGTSELPSDKAVVVGYPVREAFWSTGRQEARRRLGLPADEQVLLVSGASLGAHQLNVAVAEQLDRLLELCHVMHLTGHADEAELLARRAALPEAQRERYHVFGYLEEMALAMAAADLAVLRAGASVLGEVPAAGLPAVLVPGVYEGWDQSPNARYMEERGAAVVLENARLDELTDVVRPLLADEGKRRALGEAARRLAQPDAARRIAQLLRETSAEGATA